jgi:Uncharacterized protein conserved in bacteria (DUF2325)
LLHHEGGIEHSPTLLPGLVSRADHLFFPVDCVSHDAAATIERLCRQLEKPYCPLRTASLKMAQHGQTASAAKRHWPRTPSGD